MNLTKRTLCFFTLCLVLALMPRLSAQKPVVPQKKVPPLEVVVYRDGKITFKGKTVAFDDLKKEVQRVVSTFKNIPNTIPMKTVGEVGMGTRHEVETRIAEGIAVAKWVRKKATLTAGNGKATQKTKRTAKKSKN